MAGFVDTTRRQLPVQWTMTLGDLLTLLLCFFVVTFSAHDRGSLQKSQTGRQVVEDTAIPEHSPNGVLDFSGSMAGTLLAEDQRAGAGEQFTRSVFGVELSASDFDGEDRYVLPQSVERIEQLLAIEHVESVQVTTCSRLPNEQRGWKQSIARGIALVNVVQTVRPGLLMDVRPGGKDCELVSAPLGKGSEVQALVIATVRKDKLHG